MLTAGRNAVVAVLAVASAASTTASLAACSQSASANDSALASAASPSPEAANADPTAAATDAPSSARGIVIAQVVTHDAKVAILTSNGGRARELRVVVRKTDGTMIADGVTFAQLRATNPEIYEVVTSARASTLDATLDLGHPN